MKQKILYKLLNYFGECDISVIDNSHLHLNHLPNNPTETHFEVHITSSKLDKLSKLEAHKLIYNILHEEMNIIHALNIKINAQKPYPVHDLNTK